MCRKSPVCGFSLQGNTNNVFPFWIINSFVGRTKESTRLVQTAFDRGIWDFWFTIIAHYRSVHAADSENREITLKIGREVGMDIWKEDRIEKKLTFNRITETRFLEFKDEKKEKHTGRKNE